MWRESEVFPFAFLSASAFSGKWRRKSRRSEVGGEGVLMERGLELVCVESDTRQAVM